METKKCPYCAEEINIDAIKCKHCSEWLNKNSSPKSPPIQVQIQPIKQNFELLGILCYIAMFFALVNVGYDWGIHGLDDLNTLNGTARSFTWIIGVITIIPEWVSIIADTTLWVILIIGIKNICKSYNFEKELPFNILISFEILLGIVNFIILFINENNEDSYLGGIVGLLIFLTYAISMIIVGFKMRKQNELSNFYALGMALIIYPIISTLLSIVSVSFEDDVFISFILYGLIFIITIYPLKAMQKLFIEASENKESKVQVISESETIINSSRTDE